MIAETIDLYEALGIGRGQAKRGVLRAWRHSVCSELGVRHARPAVLVFPGGGYAMVSERENEPVAQEFFLAGYEVFVLDYDVAPLCYPVQIVQAAMAMLYIRRHAEEYGLLPDKVAAVGFSAGGHLCGCVSVLWDDPAIRALFGDACGAVRPDASVYCYPVVSADPKVAHLPSIQNFCGGAADPAAYSVERHVRSACSPAFIWANTPDDVVPPANAILLYEAYLRAGVPAELHIFREGWHGMSVCTEECERTLPVPPAFASVRPWLDLCKTFLRTLGFAVR